MTSPYQRIFGQKPAIRTLERATATDRLASAYLFEGPSGVGKEKVALALAQAVVGGDDPDLARRIAEGRHPDVRFFRPRDEGARNIAVEFVRNEILPVAQYAPFEGRAAFLIFPEADVSFPAFHPESANALLKTLEEPRPRVHFVLLSERPDRLLPTIQSRCQRIRFARLSAEAIERILERAGIAPEDRTTAAALADGRADRALALATDGLARSLLDLATRIDRTVELGRAGPLVELAEELTKHEHLGLVLETLALYYRDLAAASLGIAVENRLARPSDEGPAVRRTPLPPGEAAARVHAVQELESALERNANAQLALEAFLFRLRSAA